MNDNETERTEITSDELIEKINRQAERTENDPVGYLLSHENLLSWRRYIVQSEGCFDAVRGLIEDIRRACDKSGKNRFEVYSGFRLFILDSRKHIKDECYATLLSEIEYEIEREGREKEKEQPNNAKNEKDLKERRLETLWHINKEFPDLKTKREIFEKCREFNDKDFRITFKSFGGGSGNIWREACSRGIVWVNVRNGD